mmetsp:Transcript_117353/g.373923  ORF Transcript_117353/g.373923 Transcript_117353/m.373923 type:complete len:302 (-) Transcript_117353:2314-3219(-)
MALGEVLHLRGVPGIYQQAQQGHRINLVLALGLQADKADEGPHCIHHTFPQAVDKGIEVLGEHVQRCSLVSRKQVVSAHSLLLVEKAVNSSPHPLRISAMRSVASPNNEAFVLPNTSVLCSRAPVEQSMLLQHVGWRELVLGLTQTPKPSMLVRSIALVRLAIPCDRCPGLPADIGSEVASFPTSLFFGVDFSPSFLGQLLATIPLINSEWSVRCMQSLKPPPLRVEELHFGVASNACSGRRLLVAKSSTWGRSPALPGRCVQHEIVRKSICCWKLLALVLDRRRKGRPSSSHDLSLRSRC